MKYEKTIQIPASLFFHDIGPNFVQILPKTTMTLLFLAVFQWNILGDSININNLCFNPAFLKKKLVKPLKSCFLVPIYAKRGNYGHRSQWKMFFLGRNNRNWSLAFRNILFYQNIICFDWIMNLFPSWVMFSVKKVSFPAKTAVNARWIFSNLYVPQ